MQWFTTCGVVVLSWLGACACIGHKPHPHHNKPDTGGTSPSTSEETTVPPVSCDLIEQQYEEYGELPQGECSLEQPECSIGIECCCGRCAPNIVCECYEGSWGCYFTDFCMFPFCREGGLPDAGWRF